MWSQEPANHLREWYFEGKTSSALVGQEDRSYNILLPLPMRVLPSNPGRSTEGDPQR